MFVCNLNDLLAAQSGVIVPKLKCRLFDIVALARNSRSDLAKKSVYKLKYDELRYLLTNDVVYWAAGLERNWRRTRHRVGVSCVKRATEFIGPER